MKKILKTVFYILIGIVILSYSIVYFNQEKLIFHPEKVEKNFTYTYNHPFEEKYFEVDDNVFVNGLYFKADSSKGVLLYLHGNTGSLKWWGHSVEKFTHLNYDVLVIDYRGFGKSDGKIRSQKQIFSDNQIIYNTIKEKYKEEDIVVIGYSIGSGMAAHLAATNAPGLLILKAPYYSLVDLTSERSALIPGFLLKYKLETNKYLKSCKMPVILFHGTDDKVIPYSSSERLCAENKNNTVLIKLDKHGHNNFEKNIVYTNSMKQILKNK